MQEESEKSFGTHAQSEHDLLGILMCAIKKAEPYKFPMWSSSFMYQKVEYHRVMN